MRRVCSLLPGAWLSLGKCRGVGGAALAGLGSRSGLALERREFEIVLNFSPIWAFGDRIRPNRCNSQALRWYSTGVALAVCP